jgi:ATP-dependent Lhr-like helicase
VQAGFERLVASGQVVAGEFTPGRAGREFCGASMLRTIRRRSLAALRREVEPAPQALLAQFLPEWQGVGGARRARGLDGLARVIEQLAGVAVPASALENLVLPARVADYSPAQLDELTSSGEVLWAGAGSLAGNDGWITLVPAEAARDLLAPLSEIELSPVHKAILAALDGEQALFLRAITDRVKDELAQADDLAQASELATGDRRAAEAGPSEADLARAIWDLAFGGYLTNDTLAPVRSRLGGGRTAHNRRPAAPRSRYGRLNRAAVVAAGRQPSLALPGRWSRLPERGADDAHRALLRTEVLLDRYGILTRGEVAAEGVVGGFTAVYPVLRQGEDAGRYRRGYFVEGLGAAQFGLTGAIDRLRGLMTASERGTAGPAEALVLAATDPANPYGAALAWPDRAHLPDADVEAGKRGHQPARKAGALVVLVDGECVLYVERGGKTLLSFSVDSDRLGSAAAALAVSARAGALGKLHVESADGDPIVASALGAALEQAGFRPSPRGLRLRG